MSESTIERAVCAYAKSRGCLVMKLAGPNQKGQPDRMFLRDGRAFFMEFKAPGKLPTALQERWIHELWAHGFNASVCDEIHKGKQAIDMMIEEATGL